MPTQAPPLQQLPADPGDECLCFWPNGEHEEVHVRAFRADGRADITRQTHDGPEDAVVPRDHLAPIPF